MPEVSDYQQQFSGGAISLRDFEEKLRLLRDRVILIGQTSIEDREKTFKEVQEMKKIIIQLKDENLRIRELLERITEHLSSTARKEELAILQRQFDLFRK